jgi:hypothetical protein
VQCYRTVSKKTKPLDMLKGTTMIHLIGYCQKNLDWFDLNPALRQVSSAHFQTRSPSNSILGITGSKNGIQLFPM